jgi:hypothetical protein
MDLQDTSLAGGTAIAMAETAAFYIASASVGLQLGSTVGMRRFAVAQSISPGAARVVLGVKKLSRRSVWALHAYVPSI